MIYSKSLICIMILVAGMSRASAQSLEARVSARIAADKIDTCMVYTAFLVGGGISLDTCEWETPVWLLWVRNGQYFRQRFALCDTTPPKQMGSNNPLAYYLEQANKIEGDTIRPPTYTRVIQKGSIRDTLVAIGNSSHGLMHGFRFSVGDRKAERTVSDYDLETKELEPGKPNQYYAANRRTATFKLISLMRSLDNDTPVTPTRSPSAKTIPNPHGSSIVRADRFTAVGKDMLQQFNPTVEKGLPGQLVVYKDDFVNAGGITGSKIFIQYINSSNDTLRSGTSYDLAPFLHLPDSIKLQIIGQLLHFGKDTSRCGMRQVVHIFNAYEARRGFPPDTSGFNLQVDALYMINRIAWPYAIDLYSPVPSVFDRHTQRDVSRDPGKIAVLLDLYKQWFQKRETLGTIGNDFPFNSGRFVWYNGRAPL